jgi:dipeptidyl-peptidase-3
MLERVGQAAVVQLYADGFEKLTPRERIFSYYLYLASLAGRDIAIDQHHPRALEVRDLFEEVYTHAEGVDTAVVSGISTYLKLFWINNGFYDNLTSRKFTPSISFADFKQACEVAAAHGADFRPSGESLDTRLEHLRALIFDPSYDSILTNKSPGADWIAQSGGNLYQRDLTFAEVDEWARKGFEQHPLNSQVVRERGALGERVWRAGGDSVPPGMYAEDLRAVIKYLTLAIPYASGEYQAETIRLLISFLRTGNADDFRAYNIHWVKDTSSVDFQLGFIEVYLDPRGQKGEWEALPYFVDPGQTILMQNLARHAQYFEDAAPWSDVYKKKIERSPIANVINVIVGTGGTGPVMPIGVNLPNEQAICEEYGSKSILLHNVVEAGDRATGKELLREFAAEEEEIRNQETYGVRADNLHTAMHEVIGHGSGKVSPSLKGKDPSSFLPGYYNTLEEARADLVALWNAWDDRLVDIGAAQDAAEARKIGETMFQQAIRVALTQLRRIGKNDQLEEDHMKNRQLIAHYIIRNSSAVKVEVREGKTFYHIVDFDAARACAGELLAEVMRIKAEGDLTAAKQLIDTYGLAVDTNLRDEVQKRADRLDVPSYIGFVMPELLPVQDPEGNIIDATVDYPADLSRQMLRYSQFTRNEKAAQD